MSPEHVHHDTCSHSFTPKLFSRLANLSEVASPGRKGSAGEAESISEREGKDVKDKEKEKRGVGFPFHFGGFFLFFDQSPERR
jgi:hypothetical protein